MELIGRILDGSIPQDLKDALRRADPSGSRVTHDEKMRHLEEVPLLEDCTQKQLRAVSKDQVVETARTFLPLDRYALAIAGPPLP